jgi:hypothetical protein
MIALRNHGVDPPYIGELQDLGYGQLKIEEFIRMRSLGIGPNEVRNANARAGKLLSVDELRPWRQEAGDKPSGVRSHKEPRTRNQLSSMRMMVPTCIL